MDISKMTLKEILELKNQEYLDFYLFYFNDWIALGFTIEELKPYYGKEIGLIDPILTGIYENGHITYYKGVKLIRSLKIRSCAFCGSRIYKGHHYYRYHPFVIVKKGLDTQKLVLKKGNIDVCESCSSFIPETYEELLGLKEQLEFEHESFQNNGINFETLKDQVGEELEFKVLRKTNRKK